MLNAPSNFCLFSIEVIFYAFKMLPFPELSRMADKCMHHLYSCGWRKTYFFVMHINRSSERSQSNYFLVLFMQYIYPLLLPSDRQLWTFKISTKREWPVSYWLLGQLGDVVLHLNSFHFFFPFLYSSLRVLIPLPPRDEIPAKPACRKIKMKSSAFFFSGTDWMSLCSTKLRDGLEGRKHFTVRLSEAIGRKQPADTSHA